MKSTFGRSRAICASRAMENLLSLDFPSDLPQHIDAPVDIVAALGVPPDEMWKARDHLAVFAHEDVVRR